MVRKKGQRVAESLDFSKDAVKQSLSYECVAAIVGEPLTHTEPVDQLLLLLSQHRRQPQGHRQGRQPTVAAKGTGAVFGLGALNGMILGPLIPVIGGWLGVRAFLNTA